MSPDRNPIDAVDHRAVLLLRDRADARRVQRSMWKSRHGIPEWRPGFGPSQGRNWKTRLSTSSVSRTFFAFAYGPK